MSSCKFAQVNKKDYTRCLKLNQYEPQHQANVSWKWV